MVHLPYLVGSAYLVGSVLAGLMIGKGDAFTNASWKLRGLRILVVIVWSFCLGYALSKHGLLIGFGMAIAILVGRWMDGNINKPADSK